MILLDTCALVWWTLDPRMLSQRAVRACNRIIETGACVSSISFWELGIKVNKGKLHLGISLKDYVSRIKALNTVQIIAVDEQIWLANLSLDWSHNDPVDRTIVATAKMRGLPILTKDKLISRYYRKVVW
jgi:PIN domain nuclease of toxin-antitoxin system